MMQIFTLKTNKKLNKLKREKICFEILEIDSIYYVVYPTLIFRLKEIITCNTITNHYLSIVYFTREVRENS